MTGKSFLSVFFLVFSSLLARCSAADTLREGDILFQSNISPQCQAIKAATHSPYTHCGMILKKDGALYVYEALEPVMYTPLDEWVARSNKHYVAKRLKDTSLVTPAVIAKMKKAGEKYRGKHYDPYFEWSDERIYCSELVWKLYKETTGLELGVPLPLSSYYLSSDIVKKTMAQRYGNKIPLNEKMIAPSGIFESGLLMTVYSN